MGKKKSEFTPWDLNRRPETERRAAQPVEHSGGTLPPVETTRPVDAAPVLAFEANPRCPRCNSQNTERVWTQGNVQGRRCRAPICRHSFKITKRAI